MPFTLGFTLGNPGEGCNAAEPYVVDPSPGLGDCGEQSVPAFGRYGKTLTVLTWPSVQDETYQEDDGEDEEGLAESWTPRVHLTELGTRQVLGAAGGLADSATTMSRASSST